MRILDVISKEISGLSLLYDEEERQSAGLIAAACEKSVGVIRERWGLDTPEECHVYVMRSWPKFFFHSAPWMWKVFLALGFPFFALRFHVIWPYAGGWFLSYGRRRVVGIKPPHLMQSANVHMGDQFYVPIRSLNEKVETVTCHELAHAFSSHLKLPGWLREGMATLAMDYYLGRPVVREDTLEALSETSSNYIPQGPGKPTIENPKALLFQYICGYWQTRYIEESRPGLLRSLFAKKLPRNELENEIALGFGKEPGQFWKEINREVRDWFGEKGRAQ